MSDLPHWLSQAIREEIRAGFMWGVEDVQREVPMHDLAAERDILSSQVEVWEALPLVAADFFAPAHGAMWEAMLPCAQAGTVDRFRAAVAAMQSGGFGMALEVYASDTLTMGPATAGKPLRVRAERVRELARRRRCLRAMGRARSLVWTGKADEAIEALRCAVKELRG